MQELKEAIAKKLERDNGLSYAPNQIVVSSGAKSSLFHAICALVEEGEEVIIPSPYWLTYPELVKLAGGKCVYVQTLANNDYKITAEQLEKAITDKTKCIILNSPNNPTGSVYSKEELKALAKVIEEKKIWVISDEIYEKLVYEGEEFISIATLSEYIKDHTIVVNGLSKAYSMTGWRIGYVAGPVEVVKAISSMQSHTTSNACSIAQYASVEALNSVKGDEFIKNMVKVLDERRQYLYENAQKIDGFKCVRPKGAFYLFVDVSKHYGKSFDGEVITGSLKFADLALRKGVAVIPGVAFGDDNSIRLSYCVSMEDIREGLNRLQEFVKELK